VFSHDEEAFQQVGSQIVSGKAREEVVAIDAEDIEEAKPVTRKKGRK
jgi:hypothetical protein